MQAYSPMERFHGAHILLLGYTRETSGIFAPNRRSSRFRGTFMALVAIIRKRVRLMTYQPYRLRRWLRE